jgi:dTMP kinase
MDPKQPVDPLPGCGSAPAASERSPGAVVRPQGAGAWPDLPEDPALDDSALAGMGSGTPGVFITFEGLDGCGKSTQMELLAEALRERGYVVLVTREPGGTAVGEATREILLDPRSKGMSPRAEALLYSAARAQLVDEVIRPALMDRQIVLCDRYLDSSLAYQGYGRGLGTDDIITLNAWATDCLFPDLTLLLDLPDSLRTSRLAAVPDRLEAEDESFHKRVAAGYEALLHDHAHRMRRIDASGDPDTIQERVRAAVEEELQLFSH